MRMCERVCAHYLEQRESNFLMRDETQHQLQPAFTAWRQLLKSAYGRLPRPSCTAAGSLGGDSPWHGISFMVDLTPQRQPRFSYLYDIARVLFGPLPAPQLHPSVQRAKAGARLCAKQVILWVEVMSDSQGYFSWDQGVHVPVNRHAVNVASCVDIVQDLGEQGWRERPSISSIPNCFIPAVFHIFIHPDNKTNINVISTHFLYIDLIMFHT